MRPEPQQVPHAKGLSWEPVWRDQAWQASPRSPSTKHRSQDSLPAPDANHPAGERVRMDRAWPPSGTSGSSGRTHGPSSHAGRVQPDRHHVPRTCHPPSDWSSCQQRHLTRRRSQGEELTEGASREAGGRPAHKESHVHMDPEPRLLYPVPEAVGRFTDAEFTEPGGMSFVKQMLGNSLSSYGRRQMQTAMNRRCENVSMGPTVWRLSSGFVRSCEGREKAPLTAATRAAGSQRSSHTNRLGNLRGFLLKCMDWLFGS